MILIVMRHGEAEDFQHSDQSRALTSLGQKQCQKAGQWLQGFLPSIQKPSVESKLCIDLALVSPYLRTQQSYREVTADIEVGEQITTDAITPMGNALQSADLIHAYATSVKQPKSMLIVTHMPLVSLLADKICSEFNAKIFETADTLLIEYNLETGRGEQLAFYQANR